MKVLVACEYSGTVRDAFIARGHDAISCDLRPTETPGPHFQGDVRALLAQHWDLLIGFPPCEDLTVASAGHWRKKRANGKQQAAIDFFHMLWEKKTRHIPAVALENPPGWLNNNWRKPDQTINPCQFGEPWMKDHCLWLRGLPKLMPTCIVFPSKGYWFQSTSSAKERARTFPGVARAMAYQWGGV